MGDPDPKQIDGLRGTVSSNNKIVIVWKSEEPGVDVEYLVGQVIVGKSQVDYKVQLWKYDSNSRTLCSRGRHGRYCRAYYHCTYVKPEYR